MKKHHIIIATGLLLAMGSCKKVLDVAPLSQYNTDQVFRDSIVARQAVDYIYDQNCPAWGGGNPGNSTTVYGGSTATDEGSGTTAFFGNVAANLDQSGEFGTSLSGTNNYGKIRTINDFLQNVEAGPLPRSTKDRLEGQVYFFRAYQYFELFRKYGGVPIVTQTLAALGPDAKLADQLPRNKSSEVIAQIVSDLNQAIAKLPINWKASLPLNSDWGRITSGCAAALKGRALLYWASPQFNPTGITQRWQDAFDANTQAVALLTAGGFGLNASYDNMWFTEVNNPEAVFVTGYNNVSTGIANKNNSYDNATRPKINGTGGGSNQPSWEMVKAYPMLDGKKPGDATGKYTYTDQTFYKTRDPRFDKTIAYNGCTWPLNANTSYKLYTYNYASGKSVEASPTGTGFYCRKAIDPSVAAASVQYSGTDWMEIRYAEVLLNLAESACGINKLAFTDDSYKSLIALRARAGIEPGTGYYGLQVGMNQQQMFTAILYERQIELAFEGKRFWDIRRWQLANTATPNIYGVTSPYAGLTSRTKVTINLKTGTPADFTTAPYSARDSYSVDTQYSTYYTLSFSNMDTTQPFTWVTAYNWFAIPTGAISNNPALIQTSVGWGGAFDPLQ
jgi:hypothetical protein